MLPQTVKMKPRYRDRVLSTAIAFVAFLYSATGAAADGPTVSKIAPAPQPVAVAPVAAEPVPSVEQETAPAAQSAVSIVTEPVPVKPAVSAEQQTAPAPQPVAVAPVVAEPAPSIEQETAPAPQPATHSIAPETPPAPVVQQVSHDSEGQATTADPPTVVAPSQAGSESPAELTLLNPPLSPVLPSANNASTEPVAVSLAPAPATLLPVAPSTRALPSQTVATAQDRTATMVDSLDASAPPSAASLPDLSALAVFEPAPAVAPPNEIVEIAQPVIVDPIAATEMENRDDVATGLVGGVVADLEVPPVESLPEMPLEVQVPAIDPVSEPIPVPAELVVDLVVELPSAQQVTEEPLAESLTSAEVPPRGPEIELLVGADNGSPDGVSPTQLASESPLIMPIVEADTTNLGATELARMVTEQAQFDALDAPQPVIDHAVAAGDVTHHNLELEDILSEPLLAPTGPVVERPAPHIGLVGTAARQLLSGATTLQTPEAQPTAQPSLTLLTSGVRPVDTDGLSIVNARPRAGDELKLPSRSIGRPGVLGETVPHPSPMTPLPFSGGSTAAGSLSTSAPDSPQEVLILTAALLLVAWRVCQLRSLHILSGIRPSPLSPPG